MDNIKHKTPEKQPSVVDLQWITAAHYSNENMRSGEY